MSPKKSNKKGGESGSRMTEHQKKYSDMKNYESRIKKYREEKDFLTYMRTQVKGSGERKKISKRMIELLQVLRKEEKEYRRIKDELRHKFPGEKDESLNLLSFSKGAESLQEEGVKLQEKDYDIVREDKTEDEKKSQRQKALFEKLERQIKTTYALESRNPNSSFDGNSEGNSQERGVDSLQQQGGNGFSNLNVHQDLSQKKKSLYEKGQNIQDIRGEEFLGFESIVVEK